MVYVDLPPEMEGEQAPVAPVRAGRQPLSPKRSWRRDKVITQLVDPVVIGETAGLLEQQVGDIRSAFKPRNGWQDWLTGTIATIILRINRSERIERKLRDWASYRAIDFWEDDQTLAVETVALRIGKEPAQDVAKLRETPAGIDWLLARWQILARVEPRDWTDEQRDLAARLVGGDTGVDPARAGFVAERIAALESYRERVARPTRSSAGWSRPTCTTTASRGWPSSAGMSGRYTGSSNGTSTSSTSSTPTAGTTRAVAPPAHRARRTSGSPAQPQPLRGEGRTLARGCRRRTGPGALGAQKGRNKAIRHRSGPRDRRNEAILRRIRPPSRPNKANRAARVRSR